ncbi:MAG: type II toxin-antitoxin system RelE/ParE family toxin [Candidatus Methylomirabilis sp.]|nr:type II toxin-antitoxin system RelE/ParE family toxin [Deltaproteobacteria bacterium]
MILVFTEPFKKALEDLSPILQKRTRKALKQLAENPRHPSLRLEKLQGKDNVWSIRVTRGYRIVLSIEGETAYLRNVDAHDAAYRRP